MSGEIQFLPYGKNPELIKNIKSNFLSIKCEPKEEKQNQSLLEVCNREIFLGDKFRCVDLIREVRSPVGVKLNFNQIDRLIEQRVIKVTGVNENLLKCGAYAFTFEYYSHKKGAILFVKDVNYKNSGPEQVDLRKSVSNKLDLTKYYHYTNILGSK
ncbi:hypothetical protein [Xylocopilactobacillus apicola]|uniref:Uncharacterized protein n=1 Tax=Xylocopilactobacillus apicola TaxID=2932184 RepID=A0AAU9DA79_9LACO|nr:hypothetical protein [Xylocopilactobacillus apicola]BDR58420.1 hypothetical protein XA3_08610 [Xylocopilactobacillus apicola]